MREGEREGGREGGREEGRAGRPTWIGEINHGVKLVQIILQRGAREEQATMTHKLSKGLIRGSLCVLEPVSLIANEDVTAAVAAGREGLSVPAEGLVGDD